MYFELIRVSLVAAVSAILGLLVGFPVLALLLGLSGYVVWVSSQILALASWIASGSENDPPISSGIFELIFEQLVRQKRKQERVASRQTRELRRYLSLLSDVRDGVVLTNKNGEIRWFNHRAEELLGLSSPRDLGSGLSNFVRSPEYVAYFENLDFSETLKIASPMHAEDWLEFSVSVYDHGESLIVIRDISRVQHLEIARRDFVANLSHELRTPLTVLKGYLETLSGFENSGPTKSAISEMLRQSERMSSLVDDLSTLSRLESVSPPKHRTQIPIKGQIEQICQEQASIHSSENRQFELKLEEDLALRGDATEIYSAFTNLVANALKYGKGKITIVWKSNTAGAHFSVSDSGPGIDPKHLPRLTERFYRADSSRNSDRGGTGLGLAIVKHILLRHEGQLHIESIVGKGSTFTCQFPKDRICHSVPAKTQKKEVSTTDP